jgi:poly(A) polymerase
MQPRFEKRTGSTPFSLIDQPRFRAGFDFMRLRADVGEVDVVLADWWQEFSLASDAVREDLVLQAREEQGKGQRRVRVAKPPAPRVDEAPRHLPSAFAQPDADSGSGDDEGGPQESSEGGPSDAPRKRRRRRRKPTGEGGAPPPPSDAQPQ